MKRLPPRISDLPAPSRRRRALTGEERELWESVAKQAKPLRKTARLWTSLEGALSGAPDPAREAAAKAVAVAPANLKPSRPVPPPLTLLSRRERARLSRGKQDIEARIDLHGMTQARAHRALHNFLLRASGDGLRFVLVITGKGRAAGLDPSRGILRQQVPEWLGLPEFRTLVVGFEQAHIGHGGEGALYVRVRRRR
ncbi:Smr protein/MutS2 [Nitrobacter hamburgensis X14]|uniref:Smr protein/MutS2 n=1 Tax=Nitrobacter hamburgensis (strain DSM 10229 / NCIMB 13809 / X14) TaxID=323097 RepID=Q1QRX7_NITHX|nr:Smr/MutS family protein [Nitrobacter hamburgensis]ABE61020.1 Smr protein/MutS2 [Nitrobacter hamburgensis X14]